MTVPDHPRPQRDPELLELEQLYDDEVLVRIQAQTLPGPAGAPTEPGRVPGGLEDPHGLEDRQEVDDPDGASSVRFRRARGGLLAAAMLGVAEVFEPQPDKQSVVEFAPAPADHHDDPVEFVFVRGAPERSRIIHRPWLTRRGRRADGA